jgi:hypothetical protein
MFRLGLLLGVALVGLGYLAYRIIRSSVQDDINRKDKNP